MKTIHQLATTFFLSVVLTSCISTPKPGESPKLTQPTVSTQPEQPIQVVIPTDLTFSTPLVQMLSRSGLSIRSVQYSTYAAIFPSTDKAAWIETHTGIVEAVFFADSAEVEQIHITGQPNKTEGRYIYTIQAPPPSLLHDQTLDTAFPLYFTARNEMLMITRSEELDKTLKQIFSGQ